MPTKAQFRMTVMVFVAGTATLSLLRLWAARHSTKTGALGNVADAVQVAI